MYVHTNPKFDFFHLFQHNFARQFKIDSIDIDIILCNNLFRERSICKCLLPNWWPTLNFCPKKLDPKVPSKKLATLNFLPKSLTPKYPPPPKKSVFLPAPSWKSHPALKCCLFTYIIQYILVVLFDNNINIVFYIQTNLIFKYWYLVPVLYGTHLHIIWILAL